MAKKEKSLEEAFLMLEENVQKLEERDISLEDSFKLYKEGMELLKYCNHKIEQVEKKVLAMNEEGELHEF